MDSADEVNIFEDYESRENDEDANETRNNEETNDETSTGVKVKPPKRIVKNPRLKFNPERLCGERGIPILVDHFKNVRFQGKGHEKEDLDKLLSRLEHWTHRLFPSMKFEDCLHQIEKLGKKRPVQTCLQKIRLNMPILKNDFVKEDEEDDVQRNEDSDPVEIDAFDRLIGASQSFNPVTTGESMTGSDSLSTFSSPVQTQPTFDTSGQVLGSCRSSLTEEQKERLEHNRMLAIERRKARLAAAQQNTGESSLSTALNSQERPSSQGDFIESFDSLIRDKANKSNNSFVNNSQSDSNEDGKSISLGLNNPNSDNLGLDDLMDLVDEEEEYKAVGTTNELLEENEKQMTDSNLEQIMLNDTNGNTTVSHNRCLSTEERNMELMDLANENSECQKSSDANCVVKNNLVVDSHSKNIMTGNNLDC